MAAPVRPPRRAAGRLLDSPDLAEALESDRFKQFLDHVPSPSPSRLQPSELIIYANIEFERLTGQAAAEIRADLGQPARRRERAEDDARA